MTTSPLVRLAAMLVDVDAAEEIVQDAFVRTHGRLHGVDPDKVGAYLRSAVMNGARSQLRRRRVRRRHVVEPHARRGGRRGDGRGQLRAARAARVCSTGCPPASGEVLLLRYFADLSEVEIAETLRISSGSVKTHAHRGLATLAAQMETRP